MDKKKILLFGGTFNPIHNGHLIVARYIAESLGVNEVSFVPNGIPPHKTGVASKKHRYEMLKQALFNENSAPLFSICRYEIDKNETSYIIDTVRHFKKIMGDSIDKPYIIIGPDNLYDIENWYKTKDLAKECAFVVGISSQVDTSFYSRTEYTDRIVEEYDISTVIIPHIEIRSTEIRGRIAKGLSIKHYVPDVVEEYIKKNELYKNI